MQKFIKTLYLAIFISSCSPSGSSSEVAVQEEDKPSKTEKVEIIKEDSLVNTGKLIVKSETPAEIEESVEEDCIFDQETQTDDFIKGIPEFANYTWNDTTKTATVQLPSGDLLLAKRGGCNHFGISGKWIQNRRDHKFEDVDYWLEQGKWISKNIMPRADYETYVSMVESKAYEVTINDNHLFILFEAPHYAEWSLFVEYGPEKANPSTTVVTGYYID